MFSALSPILEELHMNNFANEILKQLLYKAKLKKLIRYLNDIILIWEEDKEEIKALINEYDF